MEGRGTHGGAALLPAVLWEPAHGSNFFPIHVHLPRRIEDLESWAGDATAALSLSIHCSSSFFPAKRHVRINEG